MFSVGLRSTGGFWYGEIQGSIGAHGGFRKQPASDMSQYFTVVPFHFFNPLFDRVSLDFGH